MSFFPHDLAQAGTATMPEIEWEEPECLLCGKQNAVPLVEAADSSASGPGCWFLVVQCQSCGLCYTSPRPSDRTIGQFYPSTYGPHRTPDPARPGKKRSWLSFGWKSQRDRYNPSWHGEGRLLDFGCGGGAFLARMHERSWQVTGIDVCQQAVSRIRAELGLNAVAGSLPHPDLRPASFDVVTMWHSLEHVHWPMDTLRAAHRLLVPGGRLLIAVPNIDSLPFRWFGACWYGLDLPRHLTHFAPWTLHLMLERTGFRVGPIRVVRHSDWLRASARRACQVGGGPFWHRLLAGKLGSRLAAWQHYLVGQSDCIMVTAEK